MGGFGTVVAALQGVDPMKHLWIWLFPALLLVLTIYRIYLLIKEK